MKIKEKKQIEAIRDNKKQPANINEDYKNKLLLSKEREIFKNIYNERLDKIEEINKKIGYDNLKYIVKTTGEEFEFFKSEDPLKFLNDIKTGKISLEEAKKQTKKNNKIMINILKRYEKEVKVIDKTKLFNARNNAIKIIEDYGSMILEANE